MRSERTTSNPAPCRMLLLGHVLNPSSEAGDCRPMLGSGRCSRLPPPSTTLAELFGLATMLINGDAIL